MKYIVEIECREKYACEVEACDKERAISRAFEDEYRWHGTSGSSDYLVSAKEKEVNANG